MADTWGKRISVVNIMTGRSMTANNRIGTDVKTTLYAAALMSSTNACGTHGWKGLLGPSLVWQALPCTTRLWR